MAAHEHRTAAADGEFARDIGRRCHRAHRNGHSAQRRAERAFDDPRRGGTCDQRRGDNAATDALRHRTVFEADDLVLHQAQPTQAIDLGGDRKLERGRDGCGSALHVEREQAKGDVRSRLLHLLLERAHALGVDPAFHRSTRDEGAKADAAQDQAFERELRERLAHGRARGLKLSASSVSDGRRCPAASRPEAICVRSIS